jgi:hypothetical protein
MIVPHLMGGLGNWLFQVAAATHYSIKFGEPYAISPKHCSVSPHAKTDYFSTIFKNIPRVQNPGQVRMIREPPEGLPIDESHLKGHDNKLLYGYFQDYAKVPRFFRQMLSLDESAAKRYPDIGERCFLHVRGGDYVNHPLHHVDLSGYYRASIARMKSLGIERFALFTNDSAYCKTLSCLADIDYIVIEENELDSLYLMTVCKAGITANSTFSWWGAFLNRKRPLCIPSKWFNDPSYVVAGYFFPEANVVDCV